MAKMQDALRLVQHERERQQLLIKQGRIKYPCEGRGVHATLKLAVLVEEVGEVAKSINENDALALLREELVQVAAVAVAWIEGTL